MATIKDYIPENTPDIDKLINTLTPQYNAYLKGRGINADVDFLGSDGLSLSDRVMDDLMSIKFRTANKINKGQ